MDSQVHFLEKTGRSRETVPSQNRPPALNFQERRCKRRRPKHRVIVRTLLIITPTSINNDATNDTTCFPSRVRLVGHQMQAAASSPESTLGSFLLPCGPPQLQRWFHQPNKRLGNRSLASRLHMQFQGSSSTATTTPHCDEALHPDPGQTDVLVSTNVRRRTPYAVVPTSSLCR